MNDCDNNKGQRELNAEEKEGISIDWLGYII